MSKFYITTPIYYVNASAQIGHAYTSIIADSLARYHRLIGDEVFFLTGTDEHGEKIAQAALSNKKAPKEFVDEVSGNFRKLWQAIDLEYDYFVRTSDSGHKAAVARAINQLNASGDIYKAKYQSLYCVPCESFWTETQVADALGLCPDCKRKVETIQEENYFFRLSKYAEWLKQYIQDHPQFIQPQLRANEILGFLNNNQLTDLCISRPKRRIDWGIDFPLDDNYIVYVWFDALLNYISAIGYADSESVFKKWWPADTHLLAKDILRHHGIFWPIMLKALGLELPKTIFAHGWWKIGEEKMSKSRGNIVNPFDLIKDIGVDGMRYFLLRETSLGNDGSFSWPAVMARYNNDLANDLGNLVYRSLNMAEKYLAASVTLDDLVMPAVFKAPYYNLNDNYQICMNNYDLAQALTDIFSFVKVMNKYIEDTKPWNLVKAKQDDQVKRFIYALLEGLRIIAIYLLPFMPKTSRAIFWQLGLIKEIDFSAREWGKVSSYKIKKEAPLFPRIESE